MVQKTSHQASLSLRIRVCHPNTRILVGLLGPCFKTGRLKPFRQHPKRVVWQATRTALVPRGSAQVCPSRRTAADEPLPKRAAVLSPGRGMTSGAITPNTEVTATFPGLSTPQSQTDADPARWESARPCGPLISHPPILVPSGSLLTISRTV